MPDEPFNNFVKEGSAGTKVQQILGDLKPEAAYFVEMNGHRTGILIVNMDNTAQMPALSEPGFYCSMPKWSFTRQWYPTIWPMPVLKQSEKNGTR